MNRKVVLVVAVLAAILVPFTLVGQEKKDAGSVSVTGCFNKGADADHYVLKDEKGKEYIVTGDAYGHLYRYPYYGPYRQHYYRAAYRPYVGPYVAAYWSAPVEQGDRHWDTDTRTLAPAYQRPQRQPNPAYKRHQPEGRRNPSYQQHHPEGHLNPTDQRRQPQWPPNQTYQQQPQRQPDPSRNGGRGNSGGSHQPGQRCGHQDQSCADKTTH